ncbi:MAG: methyltransferase domain-containing protein [Spirochaetaceae bacterium]|nr:MAG: methyltransferase domain-containing protein [Spirochaetaceae bacterium]
MKETELPAEQPRKLLAVILRLERLAQRSPVFRRLYTFLFYRRILEIEITEAQLPVGARVLHVGCGPFPVSALALADKGFTVTAIDRDPETVRTAAQSFGGRGITFVCADAQGFDYSGFEAVFVALHVAPRREVLQAIVASADQGTQVLVRNARGALKKEYTSIRVEDCKQDMESITHRLPGQKELLVLRRPSLTSLAAANGSCAVCSLCDLSAHQGGTISAVPDLPQLAAMGFRPGKDCTIVAVQPWGGPVICAVAGREIALERGVAATVHLEADSVKPLPSHTRARVV